MKPSDIRLSVPPLIATFGKAELEHAASLIVRACQLRQDEWQPITWHMVQEAVRTDVTNKTEPIASLVRNPFFNPDVWGLEVGGFVKRIGDGEAASFAFTEAGLERLKKWAVTL